MVNDSGQLYTIEGFAAAILMVVTAYLVVSTTTVLTPQDVHIIDMQLQQLGNDALAMMDTPDTYDGESNLSDMIKDFNNTSFRSQFLGYLNAVPGGGPAADSYAYNATVYYRNGPDIQSYPFNETQGYYRENAVTVSRWVYLTPFDKTPEHREMRNDTPQSVLLEVLVWRV